jgi:hypothetical protein
LIATTLRRTQPAFFAEAAASHFDASFLRRFSLLRHSLLLFAADFAFIFAATVAVFLISSVYFEARYHFIRCRFDAFRHFAFTSPFIFFSFSFEAVSPVFIVSPGFRYFAITLIFRRHYASRCH